MSDQGMFQRNINSDGSAAQPVVTGDDIASTSSVVAADTSGGDIQVWLPGQLSSAGLRITVVNVDGGGIVRVSVQAGDSMDGALGASGTVPAVVYASVTFVSTGDSWVSL